MALTLSHAKSPETTIVHGQDALVREFLTSATLVAGQTVSFDSTQTGEAQMRHVVRGAAEGYVFGVALEATGGTANETVRVLVGGYVQGVDSTGGTALNAGDSVVAGGAGVVDEYAAGATDRVLAVCLDDEAGNAVTLYWFPSMI